MSEDKHNITNDDLNRLLYMLLGIAASMFAVGAYAYSVLPDDIRIPVHWGIDGKPDRYGGKLQGLMVLPCVALAMALLFRVIPIIEPRRRNLLRSFAAFRALSLSVVIFMFVLHTAMVASVLGFIQIGITSIVGMMVCGLMIVLGNYLGKVRSNFLVGIRTPWTLSSDFTWDRTHRFGGRLLVMSGLAGIVLHVVLPRGATIGAVVLVIASALAAVVYSYFVWLKAPDRRSD